MTKKYKALVVDDHPLMANATKDILQQIDEIEVVGVVGNSAECLAFVHREQPDMIFLDYHLPDQLGSKTADQIKKKYPSIHIIIFTGIDVTEFYNQLIEIGVSGIISKGNSDLTIKNMIRCILDHHTIVPLSLYRQLKLTLSEQSSEPDLTEDEVQIMTLLVQGSTHEEIADQIHVSKRSVDNYLKRIYYKLGVKSKIQALEKYVQTKYYTSIRRKD